MANTKKSTNKGTKNQNVSAFIRNCMQQGIVSPREIHARLKAVGVTTSMAYIYTIKHSVTKNGSFKALNNPPANDNAAANFEKAVAKALIELGRQGVLATVENVTKRILAA